MKIGSAMLGILFVVPALAHASGDAGPVSQKLGPDVRIALPGELQLRSYPMPIPGASNYRIDTGSMRIAITGIPLDMGGGPPAAPRSDDKMKEGTLRSAAQYRAGAANPDAAPSLVKGEGWAATYVTYAAKAGEAGFVPFMGAAYQCVSTGEVATARTVFILTVGSADCAGGEHQDFLKALETITVEG